MGHAPWSVSKASVAHDCNLRYNFKYNMRNKGRPIERGEGRIGSAFHAIVEKMLLGEEYQRAFKTSAVSNRLTRNEMLELSTFKDAVGRFLTRLDEFRTKHDVAIGDLLVEQDVAISEDLEPAPYWPKEGLPSPWLRGSADVMLRVRKNDKKYLIIIDHKTGAIKPLETYETQLKAYGIMGLFHEPDIAGVQACIHWPRAEEEDEVFAWGKMWQAETIRTQIVPWMQNYLAEAGEKGDGPHRPTEGWYCAFCEYQHACPAKRVPRTTV